MQNCAQCGTPLPYGTTTCPACGLFVAYNSPSWSGYNAGNGGAVINQNAFQTPYPPSSPTYLPPSQQGQPPYIEPMSPTYSPPSQQGQPPYIEPMSPSYGPPFQQGEFSPSMPSYGPPSQQGQLPYTGPISQAFGPPSQQGQLPYTGPVPPTNGPSSQILNPFPPGPISQVYGPPSQLLNQPPVGSISQVYGPSSQPLNPQTYADFGAQANIAAPYYGPPPIQPMQPPPFARPGQSGRAGSSGNAGQGLSKKTLISVIVLTFLLIGSGISLIFYTAVARPAQMRAQANATVQAIANNNVHATATANTYITATAKVSATAQAQAQATANAIEATYTQSTNHDPIFNSSMAFQDQANWDTYNAVGGGGCAFTGGALHSSIAQRQFYVPCFAQATNFNNFVFEVEMTILKGDEGGLIFRANDANSKFYYFRVGRDGIYSLNISKDDKHSTPIAFDSSPAIKTGMGQTNLITVIAKGSTIYLYINKHFVSSTTDTSYNAGKIGVFAGDNRNATDVAFSNARVWQL